MFFMLKVINMISDDVTPLFIKSIMHGTFYICVRKIFTSKTNVLYQKLIRKYTERNKYLNLVMSGHGNKLILVVRNIASLIKHFIRRKLIFNVQVNLFRHIFSKANDRG